MHHLQIRQNALLLTFSNRQIVIISSPHSISLIRKTRLVGKNEKYIEDTVYNLTRKKPSHKVIKFDPAKRFAFDFFKQTNSHYFSTFHFYKSTAEKPDLLAKMKNSHKPQYTI